MAKGLFLPGSILSIHRKAAERLLKAGDSDAALLYLCLLAEKDASSLNWPADRLEKAHRTLLTLELADPDEAITPQPPKKPADNRLPDYTSQDIAHALEHSGTFAGLVQETERLLGKILSPTDLKNLYLLQDYYLLPPEVILTLIGWCKEQTAKQYGPGRTPTFPQIKREAQKWYEAGIASLDAADAYLHRQQKLGERSIQILALMGIHREPVAQEKKYLDAWIQMDFPDEVLRLAYERTQFRLAASGERFSWSYMNGILVRWHQQGLKTVEAIEAAEAPKKPRVAPARPQNQSWNQPSALASDDIGRMIEAARQAAQNPPEREG